MSSTAKVRSRHPILAILLSVVGSPATAMLYLGRGRRALLYLVLVFACPFVSYQMARAGLWPAGISWAWLYVFLLIVGSVDAYRLARRFRARFNGVWFSTWKGMTGIAVAYLFAVIGFRASLFEPFRIPAASMMPTLAIDDHFFANKFIYGFRLPFTSLELTAGEAPERGDIIVFWSANEDIRFIKRIMGLPGDVVSIDPGTKQVAINDVPVEFSRIGSFEEDPDFELAREEFGDRQYYLFLNPNIRSRGGVYAVPEGHYFVLGDSRDNSLDSRYSDVGFVPEENIIGRAYKVWWNTGSPERAGIPL